MYYSYVMGIDESINELKEDGFTIEPEGDNYKITFPSNKAQDWEKYIASHLESGFWNEYLADNSVIFLFHLEDGIKRYQVFDFKNDEVLALCDKLCNCRFESIKAMLMGNSFYQDKIK